MSERAILTGVAIAAGAAGAAYAEAPSAFANDASPAAITANYPGAINELSSLSVLSATQNPDGGFNFSPLIDGTTSNTATAPGSTTTTTVTVEYQNGKAHHSDVATKNIIFGANEYIKESKSTISPKNCEWTHGAFINSVKEANGKLVYYVDPVNAELCRDSNSPTGWVKVAGGTTGVNCGNAANFEHKPVPGPIKENVVNVESFNTKFTLKAKSVANILRNCGDAKGTAEVDQTVSLKQYEKDSNAQRVALLDSLKDRASTKASASVQCENKTTTTTTTTTTPGTPVTVTPTPGPTGPAGPTGPTGPTGPSTPTVPGVAIQKQFIGSYDAWGNLYSNIATQHGDTDEWKVTVENTGNDTLNAKYLDTPPQGEQNINDPNASPAQPFGFQVDGSGNGSWNDTLTAGEQVTFTVYTENETVPCFTNVLDTVDVTGTDSAGKVVTAEAQAYTKEMNTGSDCIATPPPTTGPGQPLPGSSN